MMKSQYQQLKTRLDDEILTISTDLTLSGGLSSDVTDLTKVGNVAVTIAEAVK